MQHVAARCNETGWIKLFHIGFKREDDLGGSRNLVRNVVASSSTLSADHMVHALTPLCCYTASAGNQIQYFTASLLNQLQCCASPLFSLFCPRTPFLFSAPPLIPRLFNRWQKMWDELNAMHRLTKGKLGLLQQGSDRLAPEARFFLSLKPLNCCRTLPLFLFFSLIYAQKITGKKLEFTWETHRWLRSNF